MQNTQQHPQFFNSPFLLNNEDAYQYWRDKKLTSHPQSIEDLLVEISDPRNLTQAEYKALLSLTRSANMAIYVGKTGTDPSPEIPLAIANRFGLGHINKNYLADDNGLTSLTVVNNGVRKNYIPYTNRQIHWHTDGYYNAPEQQIHALNLHVVQRAATGGENQLMDHEIAYIMLRDKNPDYIRALMQDNVMLIPAGTEPGGGVRPDRSGPIFSVTDDGNLHMRYTARVRHVEWSQNPLVQEAKSYLEQILNNKHNPYIFRGLLEPGMGLISNNVLHDRAAFTDSHKTKRHYYRARYFDRLPNTDIQSQI